MPDLVPTEEQQACIHAAKRESASLLINALAGAAKTSTLVMMAHAMPVVPTTCVAFNKKIAEEMKRRMPGYIECSTMNSVGHRAWARMTNRRPIVDADKMYTLLSNEMDAAAGEDKRTLGEIFASVLRAARAAKAAGYIPKAYAELGTPLISEAEFLDAVAATIDFEPDDFFLFQVDRILEKSIADAFSGQIDYDDQIYMSALFEAPFPRYAVTMVDEAQDLSPMNHLMLRKMYGGRLIAVGDPNQAIYGFRGAHASSMSVLREEFEMKELTLSTSFRCPKAVIRRAQKRVPHMTWPEWAIEGKVESLQEWNTQSVPDGAAIICRNNAPLFKCALQFIRSGRGVKLMGNDVGPALIKLMKKLGPDTMKQADVFTAIDEWEKQELEKARESRRAGIIDRAECMRVFADYGDTLAAAMAWAKNLFAATGNVVMMTGHKSKGLEYDIVYHLDPWRIPSKYARLAAMEGNDAQLQQEYNLRYVIETRAKKEMYLVNLEDLK